MTHTWNVKKNVIFEKKQHKKTKKNQESSHQTMYSLPHDPFGSLQIIFIYLWLEIQLDKIIRSLTHRLLRQEDRKLEASLGCRLRLSQKNKSEDVADCCSSEALSEVVSVSFPFLCYWDGTPGFGYMHFQSTVLRGLNISVMGD